MNQETSLYYSVVSVRQYIYISIDIIISFFYNMNIQFCNFSGLGVDVVKTQIYLWVSSLLSFRHIQISSEY